MRYGLLFIFVSIAAILQGEEAPASVKEKEVLKEESSETLHTLRMGGKEIAYKATAGTLLFKQEGSSKASFFFVSYIKEGEDDHSQRPITFCFNGGPGSSSVWLHMGVLGPKRVEMQQEGITSPPYNVVDNVYSLLDETDLVFIDPVSTGYSRSAPGEDVKQFHGVEEDIKSVAEFIRLFTTRYNRWDSPKFLVGESYGTLRAAALAYYLHNEMHYYLNGVVLVSSVLNFQTLDADPGNDLSYILFLPSFTATAWYYKKLAPELQQDLAKTLAEAEHFAIHDYAQALLLGDALPAEQRSKITEQLARYTGLSKNYIKRANLRVCQSRFCKELLRDENRTVGRFDSRFQGIDADSCSDVINYDPSADAVFGAFTGAFNSYIRSDLKWEKDEEYKILANVWPWNFGNAASNRYLNVSDDLRDAMTKNPDLQIYVASGYYDLATPYFGTDYTLNHLGLDPSLRSHVKKGYYSAGHMMYIHHPSLEQFKREVSEFMQTTLRATPAASKANGVKNPYIQK